MGLLDDIDPDEQLLPELAPYLTTAGALPMLAHPLVHTILPMASLANRQYRMAIDALDDAAKAQDWRTWIDIHAKPYRMQALHELVDEGTLGLGDEPLITELLIHVWVLIENVWQVHDELEQLIEWIDRAVVDADPFMAELPDTVTVYRGHHGVNEAGHSWTTDRAQAEWFASRFRSGAGELLVAERTVSKAKVIFATNVRGEHEVVIRP